MIWQYCVTFFCWHTPIRTFQNTFFARYCAEWPPQSKDILNPNWISGQKSNLVLFRSQSSQCSDVTSLKKRCPKTRVFSQSLPSVRCCCRCWCWMSNWEPVFGQILKERLSKARWLFSLTPFTLCSKHTKCVREWMSRCLDLMRRMISTGHLETIPFESFLTTSLYKKSCYNWFPALVMPQVTYYQHMNCF